MEYREGAGGEYMAKRDRLPIGIEDFSEIRTWGYHYVDKTGLIKDLLGRSWKGGPVHPSQTIWEDLKYEHAPALFCDRLR